MKYKVVLRQSEEGFSVSCPGLPGCWSQGKTEEEALGRNLSPADALTLAPAPSQPSSDSADQYVSATTGSREP